MTRPGSLRKKLLSVVMSSTCAALLLSASALFIYEFRSYRVNLEADLSSQADLVALSVGPALAFNDARAAEETLAALKLRQSMEAAAAYRANGQVFATFSAGPDFATRVPATSPRPGFRFDRSSIELVQPVVHNGEVLGSIFLRSHHDLAGRIGDYTGILLIASLGGLILAALIFRRLQPTVTGPILAMAEVARRVKEERTYELQVAETSDDEVGSLVTSFNEMLRELSTEMKERHKAEDALRLADRRKDEFLATLAHELRNPLAPISNALTILRLADDNPALRTEARAIMERQLSQVTRLIGDLLEVSRITTGKLELRRAVLDLVAVARGALETAEPTLRQSRHVVQVTLPGTPVWVDGDALRLGQVFVNLLHNAAKYTPAGAHIRFGIEERGGRAQVTVSDDGIGIDPDFQQSIFEMFVQVDQSIERGAAGLGLGLTIARQLIGLHGGSIRVFSAGLGKGSTFTVELPLAAAPVAPSTTSVEQAAPGTTPLDVLIADDNVDFANSFGNLLDLDGNAIRVVHDGRSAYEAAREAPPDVAFLDIGMPAINGYDLARLLRAEASTRAAVLVAVTGWGQEADRDRVHAAGFDYHLVKPVDAEELKQVLAEVVSRVRRRRGRS
jgi:two-component system, sensor histidine kinase